MEYNEKVLEHFFSPRNIGELKNPDGLATVGDPNCGDFIKVWIKVNGGFIKDFKYKVFGCGAAIATTSVVSEMVIGKPIAEAIEFTDDDVIAFLGGLPKGKKHCSLLGIMGLRAALSDVNGKANHKKYAERVELFRSKGYDIVQARERLVQHLASLLKEAQVLDVGTGKGHLAIAMAKAGRFCVSIDRSADEQHLAYLNAVYFGVQELIDFRVQNASNLDFPSNFFHAVLSADFSHHLSDPEPVLTEMLRVCQKGGLILIADLNKRGQAIVADIHKGEGRVHNILGRSMKQIQMWFERQGHCVEMLQEDCEIVLKIQSTSQ